MVLAWKFIECLITYTKSCEKLVVVLLLLLSIDRLGQLVRETSCAQTRDNSNPKSEANYLLTYSLECH